MPKGVNAYRDGQVVAASKLRDLTSVAERGTHDDGLVAKLLVVVEDVLDRLDTGVLLLLVLLLVGGLVPVQDTADKGADEEGVRLGGGDGLDQAEHKGQVAVDAVVALQDLSGLDALPGGGDLDEDAVLGDPFSLVELDDVQGLVDRGLGVEGEAGVNLGRDLAGDDLEDLLAELDQETVQRSIDLIVDRAALLLGVGNGVVDELGVLGLLGGSQDQGRVGGSILRLVLANGSKVTCLLVSWLWLGYLVCVCSTC